MWSSSQDTSDIHVQSGKHFPCIPTFSCLSHKEIFQKCTYDAEIETQQRNSQQQMNKTSELQLVETTIKAVNTFQSLKKGCTEKDCVQACTKLGRK